MSIREAREHLSHIEELARQEGEILLTRRGKPVAKILPLEAPRRLPSRQALRQRMPRLATGSEHLVRADRDDR